MIKPFFLVEEKFSEAEFFLDKLTNSRNNITELKYYFNAFVSAARNTTFVLQFVMEEVPGFKAWWENESNKNDPLAKYFNSKRIKITHKSGDSGIGALGFYNDEKGERIPIPLLFPNHPPIIDPSDIKSYDVVSNSQKYILWLKEIIEKTKFQFNNQIYQQGIFDKEYINKTNLTIEQIEELLGYPKGFTSFCSNDEERLLYLQALITYDK